MIPIFEDVNQFDNAIDYTDYIFDELSKHFVSSEWTNWIKAEPKSNPPYSVYKDDWVYTNMFLKRSRKYSDRPEIIGSFYTPVGNFLYEKRYQFIVTDVFGKPEYYISLLDKASVGRIKKTSMKTPDNQVIYSYDRWSFVKDAKGQFVPYTDEVIEK